MAATKFLDAMGRMPGCEGEDFDAVGAYTQVSLDKETLKLLVGEGVFIDTWVALPRNRWPRDKNGKFCGRALTHQLCRSSVICTDTSSRAYYGRNIQSTTS